MSGAASLVVFDDVHSFRDRVEEFLLEHEAENNLLFGIMHGVAGGRYPQALLAHLEEDGTVTAVALRTPPHNLVLSYAPERTSRTFAHLLDPDLPGVSAPLDVAEAFAAAWSERTGRAAGTPMKQRIYALREVTPPLGVAGRARLATHDDSALLSEWMEAFAAEALGPGDPNAINVDERVRWVLDDQHSGFLLWEVNGETVSFAGHSGPTPNGVRVGPVYTPPPFRRRGYAAACVAELSARLLASGRTFCFLYTDLANPTSNSVYSRIGYKPVCDAAMYRFS